jgi:hypothetical protein
MMQLPLSKIDETFDTHAGTKWICTPDLHSGYWQVALHPEDKEKTGFSAGHAFGLWNPPATFEQVMEPVIKRPYI